MCNKCCNNEHSIHDFNLSEDEAKLLALFGMQCEAEERLNRLAATKVIVSGNHIIVLWNDGTKTKTTCREDDNFSIETGVMVAFLKKVFGTKTFHAKIERAMKKVIIQKSPAPVKKTPAIKPKTTKAKSKK